jgi:hypothetical protein
MEPVHRHAGLNRHHADRLEALSMPGLTAPVFSASLFEDDYLVGAIRRQ